MTDRAARLHATSLVVDGLGFGPVQSTPAQLRGDPPACGRRRDEQWYWHEVAGSGVNVINYTVGSESERAEPFTFTAAIDEIALWTHAFDTTPRLLKVTCVADARRAFTESRFGVILNFQDTAHLDGDLANIELFHRLGIRGMQLTYNARNLVGVGCTDPEPGGLTSFGRDVVSAMNAVGMLIDVSHCCEQTSLDAIEASALPIAVTHGTARAVHDHQRGKSDDMLRAIRDYDGYFGVCAVPFFLTDAGTATLDDFMRHFEHVVEILGTDRVGIGTDWGFWTPPELTALLHETVAAIGFRPEHGFDPTAQLGGAATFGDWPNFTRAFVEAGYSDEEVRGFIGGNFMRVFATATGDVGGRSALEADRAGVLQAPAPRLLADGIQGLSGAEAVGRAPAEKGHGER